ncbi:MAG: hypothetical protein LBC88_02900 [Spirochaetaceae bacterium]|nr:hypothetical protein [Spirochaetaceae bacterium]
MPRHVKGPFNTRLMRAIFYGGLFLIHLGSAFLLAAFAKASRLAVIVASLFIIFGALCAFLAVKLNKRSVYLFLATFFILAGFFILLSSLRILPVALSRWWPAVSIFTGLALIPTGWRHYGSIKPHYMVPSIIFIMLGVFLLIFSLDIVDFSFRQFLIRWWHLLLVMAGLILMLVSLGTKFLPEDTGCEE